MNTTRTATKPRTRLCTAVEVAKYEAAVAPLLAMPVGTARQEAIFKLRESMGIFVNFGSGRRVYRVYNR
jgi:hypothetical protein